MKYASIAVRGLCATAFLTATLVSTAVSHAQTSCPSGTTPTFTPGFADLGSRIGSRMGAALECEHRDPRNADAVIQQTTTGWNMYQFSTNTFMYTNGYQWWGIQGQAFGYWTQDPNTNKASALIPAFSDAACAANPNATGPGLAVYCFNVFADDKIAELVREQRAAAAAQAQAQAAQAQAQAAIAAQSSYAAPTGGVVESRIDGDFEGWDGETVFVLQNGQIWQQATYDYIYHYAYSPSVLIYPSSGGWHLRVEGVDRTIAVRRLR